MNENTDKSLDEILDENDKLDAKLEAINRQNELYETIITRQKFQQDLMKEIEELNEANDEAMRRINYAEYRKFGTQWIYY